MKKNKILLSEGKLPYCGSCPAAWLLPSERLFFCPGLGRKKDRPHSNSQLPAADLAVSCIKNGRPSACLSVLMGIGPRTPHEGLKPEGWRRQRRLHSRKPGCLSSVLFTKLSAKPYPCPIWLKYSVINKHDHSYQRIPHQ